MINPAAETAVPAPDLADVPYGPHPRQVYDLWRPRTAALAPLLLFIHGGGFMGGDKTKVAQVRPAQLLAAGFVVAAIGYRLTDSAPFPTQMRDAARALQQIRSRASEHGIDPDRVACAGGSAGAGISQWLGFHPDLAEPEADDPIARQSTRIQAVAALNMQCTYDPRLIREIVPGDAYQHVAMKRLFAVGDDFDWDRDEIAPETDVLIRACGPLSHLRADAPPLFICNQSVNEKPGDIHHPNFGRYLAARCVELGIDHQRCCSGDFDERDGDHIDAMRAFLVARLT